jgi:hypothetical protein
VTSQRRNLFLPNIGVLFDRFYPTQWWTPAQQLGLRTGNDKPIGKNSIDFRSANSKTSQMRSFLYPNCLVLVGWLAVSALADAGH